MFIELFLVMFLIVELVCFFIVDVVLLVNKLGKLVFKVIKVIVVIFGFNLMRYLKIFVKFVMMVVRSLI